MICRYCGEYVKDGANFCNHCGADLSGRADMQSTSYAEPQQYGQNNQPYSQQQYGQNNQPYPQQQYGQNNQPYPQQQYGQNNQPYPQPQYGQIPPFYPQPQEYTEALPKKKTRRVVIIIIVIVVVMGLIGAILVNGSLDISRVKYGAPQARPDVTWGEALQKVSSNGKWKAYRDDGERYVRYTGKIRSSGDKLEVVFRMKDSDNFIVEKIRIGSDVYIEGEDDEYMYKVIRNIFDDNL